MAVFVDDALAVFLEEFALLRRQQVENKLGGAAETNALGGDDDRPIDEDRMRQRGVKKLIVGETRIVQPEFRIGRPLLAQQAANRDRHARDEFAKQAARRRRLQIFDDMRLDAGIADHGERVARRAAIAERTDPIGEIFHRKNEGFFLFDRAAADRGGIFDRPMRGHGMTGPYGANLAGRVVANREHEIHLWRIGARECVPTLRVQARRREARFGNHF
ncbi:hypothetical protein GW17_00060188 [Ensete ventricosum]|nr:hypothetical protein GW17_00060188 [Ensete ventricosum]